MWEDKINELIEFFRKEREKLLEETKILELPPAKTLFKAKVIYKGHEFECWLAYNNVTPKEFFSKLEQLFVYAKPAKNILSSTRELYHLQVALTQELLLMRRFLVYIGNIIAVWHCPAANKKIPECYDFLISNDQAIRFIPQEKKPAAVLRVKQAMHSYQDLLEELIKNIQVAYDLEEANLDTVVRNLDEKLPAKSYKIDLANLTITREKTLF